MAKKNSTKTATKEALEASEPRLQTIRQWQGVNFAESPNNWSFLTDENSQTDLMPNYLLVQNNVVTTDMKALETRPHEETIFVAPSGYELTGVTYMFSNALYAVLKKGSNYSIAVHDMDDSSNSSYKLINITYKTQSGSSSTSTSFSHKITHIYSYINNEVPTLIVLTEINDKGMIFTGSMSEVNGLEYAQSIVNPVYISDPTSPISYVSHGVSEPSSVFDDITLSIPQIWETMMFYCDSLPYSTYYTSSGATRNSSGSISQITFKGMNPTYGGLVYCSQTSQYPSLINDGYYYIDTNGNMLFRYNNNIYKFIYSSRVSDMSTTGFYYAYWSRLFFDDGIQFDSSWYYQWYPDTSLVPNGADAPYTWYRNINRVDLTQSVFVSQFRNSPAYVSALSSSSIDPDDSYTSAYSILNSYHPTDDGYTNWYTTWGYDASGSMWIYDKTTTYVYRAEVEYAIGNRDLYYKQGPNKSELLALPNYLEYSSTVSVASITYAYENKFGQTLTLAESAITPVNLTVSPADFTRSKYLTIGVYNVPVSLGVTNVNFYCMLDESTEPIFIGSVETSSGQTTYSYDWYGSLSNTDEWTSSNLVLEDYNTTQGPDARYCRMHDGRLFFWGCPTKQYRLMIGGDTGHELSSSRGYGGAYIDIEPGLGTIINATQKWKTTSGAAIVTILCGNENTSLHKRFNLVQSNITIDSELSETSWMVEEIPNTVGSQSYWGSGVWKDGMYVLSRYGLTLTTMAMEYNSQIQSQTVSDVVKPAFTDLLGKAIENARMVHVDGIIYIVFGTDNDPYLDRLILCYDIDNKAWYTFTYGDDDTNVLHVMNVDYIRSKEGLGIVCDDHIALIPSTGTYDYIADNEVNVTIETGEISTMQPTVNLTYIAQLEFRFDWFIGDIDIDLDGVDYYGRHVSVHKHIHKDAVVNDLVEWMRVNYLLENYHLKISGKAMFRMTHFISKVYQQSNRISLVRGYDSLAKYKNRKLGETNTHHYIKNYVNLRETLLP